MAVSKNTPLNRAMGFAVARCQQLNEVLRQNREDDPFWQPSTRLHYIAGKSGRVGCRVAKLQDKYGNEDMGDAICIFDGVRWVPSALAWRTWVVIPDWDTITKTSETTTWSSVTEVTETSTIEYYLADIPDDFDKSIPWITDSGGARLPSVGTAQFITKKDATGYFYISPYEHGTLDYHWTTEIVDSARIENPFFYNHGVIDGSRDNDPCGIFPDKAFSFGIKTACKKVYAETWPTIPAYWPTIQNLYGEYLPRISSAVLASANVTLDMELEPFDDVKENTLLGTFVTAMNNSYTDCDTQFEYATVKISGRVFGECSYIDVSVSGHGTYTVNKNLNFTLGGYDVFSCESDPCSAHNVSASVARANKSPVFQDCPQVYLLNNFTKKYLKNVAKDYDVDLSNVSTCKHTKGWTPPIYILTEAVNPKYIKDKFPDVINGTKFLVTCSEIQMYDGIT